MDPVVEKIAEQFQVVHGHLRDHVVICPSRS
jgi:hypothetical protein